MQHDTCKKKSVVVVVVVVLSPHARIHKETDKSNNVAEDDVAEDDVADDDFAEDDDDVDVDDTKICTRVGQTGHDTSKGMAFRAL